MRETGYLHRQQSFVMRPARALAVTLLATAVLIGGCSSTKKSTTSTTPATGATAVITGPVRGGAGVSFLLSPKEDLASFDYHESEWFASGTARSYRAVGATGKDGRWNVTPAASARYRTRVLTFVPDPAKFTARCSSSGSTSPPVSTSHPT